MKRCLYIITCIIIISLTSSCFNSSNYQYVKGRGYTHSNLIANCADKNNLFYSDFYIESLETDNEVKFVAYNNKNNIVDNIMFSKRSNKYLKTAFIYNNTIHMFLVDYEINRVFCYYKTLFIEEAEVECIEVECTQKYININGLTFLIKADSKYEGFEANLVGYNIIQRNMYYTSVENQEEIYSIEIINDEIVMSNYYNEDTKYSYPIAEEIINATYLFGGNLSFKDALRPKDEEKIAKGSFTLINNTTKLLENNYLYFAYGRYLGEFEKCYCFDYCNCILSNRMCEILRFNTTKKEIERVALIPETYTVLSIYEDCAIIMNNERIGTYYYDTQEIKDSIEVDIAGEIFKTEYEWPDINAVKFYFKDKKIEKYVPYKSNNLSLNSYSNILFVK